MTLGKATGIAMIAAVFVAMFIGGAVSIGVLPILMIFAGVALLMVWLFVGVSLINPIR